MRRLLSIWLSLVSFCAVSQTITNKTIMPSGGNYASLAAWEAGMQMNLVASNLISQATISGTWTTNDVNALTIDGWTTGISNYIVITNSGSKHDGKRFGSASGAYGMAITNSTTCRIIEDFVRVYGLQIQNHANSSTFYGIEATGQATNSSFILIADSIINSNSTNPASVYSMGVRVNDSDANVVVLNTLVHSGGSNTNASQANFRSSVGSLTAINCTSVGGYASYTRAGTLVATNCVAQNALADGFGSGVTGDYNLSDITSDAPGSHSINSYNVEFVNETPGSEDFHITSANASVIGAGFDNAFSPATDIDGKLRWDWDIGASEYIAPTVAWTGFSVDTNGWVLNGYLSGYVLTNGTFNFGWATNNSITSSNGFVLQFDRAGFNGTSPVTRRKTAYGGARIRFPYPGNSFPDTVFDSSSGITRVRFSLSDEVYSNDTAIAAWALPGLYTFGGTTTTNAANVTVTNLSSLTYPRVVGNWLRRGWGIEDSRDMELRFIAFHQSADELKPVSAVQFYVTDGTSSYTNTVTTITKLVHPLWSDMPVIQAYVASFPTSYFGASKRVLGNVRVYPLDGDTNTILDTATTGYVEPTVFPCPITNFVNWPRVRAVVSSTGVNASGVAANETYWATNSSPAEFLNIGAAMAAIQGTNTASYSISNCTGGIVLLKDWTTWLGSSVSGALMDGEVLITRHPSKSWDEVGVTNYSTDRVVSSLDILRFYDMTIDTSASLVWTTGARGHTWDRAFLKNTTGARVFGSVDCSINIMNCLVSNTYGGFLANSSDNCMFGLVTGNRFVGDAKGAVAYTFVGNKKTATNTFALVDASSSRTGMTKSAPTIIAYNYFPSLDVSYFDVGADSTSPCTWGQAVVQNFFGFNGSSPATYGASFWQSDDIHATNVMAWNNTFIGAKWNTFYDNLGSNTPTWRLQCQLANNVFSTKPIKSDTFTSDHPDGVRIGNWMALWSVNFSGNAYVMTTNLADFADEEFGGINTWYGSTSPTNYVRWIDERVFNGITNFAGGGGDYHLQTQTPLHEFIKPRRVVLPYDIEGNARGYTDPPGAYNSASPRKAGAFFNN